jgi:hypothetical protein
MSVFLFMQGERKLDAVDLEKAKSVLEAEADDSDLEQRSRGSADDSKPDHGPENEKLASDLIPRALSHQGGARFILTESNNEQMSDSSDISHETDTARSERSEDDVEVATLSPKQAAAVYYFNETEENAMRKWRNMIGITSEPRGCVTLRCGL